MWLDDLGKIDYLVSIRLAVRKYELNLNVIQDLKVWVLVGGIVQEYIGKVSKDFLLVDIILILNKKEKRLFFRV